MKLGAILTLPALVLHTTASVLRMVAAAGSRLADALAADEPTRLDSSQPSPPPSRGPDPADALDQAAQTSPPRPDEAAVPSDVPTLLAQPAPRVIASLASMSALDLADVYEYEARHRRRPAVLAAVEAAAAPPPAARTPDPLPADDVRVPDELVYSTQTPRRS